MNGDIQSAEKEQLSLVSSDSSGATSEGNGLHQTEHGNLKITTDTDANADAGQISSGLLGSGSPGNQSQADSQVVFEAATILPMLEAKGKLATIEHLMKTGGLRTFGARDVLFRLQSGEDPVTFTRTIQQSHDLPKKKSATVIPLWPLPFNKDLIAQDPSSAASAANGWRTQNQYGPKEYTILLIAVWLFACILMFDGWKYFHLLNNFIALKALGLAMVGMLAGRKGFTHIKISKTGVDLEYRAGEKVVSEQKLAWKTIKSIAVEPARSGKPLDANLTIRAIRGGLHRIRLRKFGNAERWQAFVTELLAAKKASPEMTIATIDLDLHLLDSVAAAEANPSYTRLWLDALAAPPRRERLQPLSAGTQLQNGRFTVDGQLGRGGQGCTYLATNAEYGIVVLKEYILPVYVDVNVRKQALAALDGETKMLSGLHHPRIVRILDTFFEDQRAYSVLERVQGTNLRDFVRLNGVVSEQTATSLGLQMCEILQYLHELTPPVMHQDFTPDNLILTDGGLKLIDFSGAQYEEGQHHTVIGKHHYMSPEQFRGKPTVQSDIYAMGCTLFYLVTGQEPEPISQSHPRFFKPELSALFNSVVEKATATGCRERYAKASDAAKDLQGGR